MNLESLPAKQRLALLLKEKARRATGRKIERYYPETGPLRRELYTKHLATFAAGAREQIRLLMAANRVGKTEGVGGYEMVMHLTGDYPAWWTGRRWDRPIDALTAGDTRQTTRDIQQQKLMGPPGAIGTGLIPRDKIVPGSVKPAQGVPDAIESCRVYHKSGGQSRLRFRSYDQGRKAFQGFELDFGWEDEEPPLDIHSELLIRVMTTKGMLLLTFTPLQGITQLIEFLRKAGTWEMGLTWADAPHLTEEDKAEILKNTPAHLRDARSKGVPLLGEGVVFKDIVEESLWIESMPHTPRHWRRIVGLDFGWDHPTAAVDLWHDPDGDIIYVANEAREREMTPILFAGRIRPWFKDGWPKVAWPHDGLQHDKGSGEQLAKQYRDAGLPLLADRATYPDGSNGLEASIFDLYERMQTGRVRVVKHLTGWLEEFRNLHRKDGQIVKERDDLIAATRYALMCLRFAETAPVKVVGTHLPLVGDRSAGY